MPKSFCRKKGQGVSAEYVVLIVLVSISIILMTTFVRRAIQARYFDANVQVALQASAVLNQAVLLEYEPYYVETTSDVDSSTSAEVRTVGNGAQDRVNTLQRKVNSRSLQKPF